MCGGSEWLTEVRESNWDALEARKIRRVGNSGTAGNLYVSTTSVEAQRGDFQTSACICSPPLPAAACMRVSEETCSCRTQDVSS